MIRLTILICIIILLSNTATPQTLGDRLIMGIFVQEHMPLTYKDAISAGWKDLTGTCDVSFGHRLRYFDPKTGLPRLTPTLMFDQSGNLFGFQVVTNTSIFPFYPASNMHIPFTMNLSFLEPNTAGYSFYFNDPQYICNSTKALSKSSSESQIGDRLWLRQGMMSNSQTDFEVIPLTVNQIIGGSPSNGWSAGGCAASGFAYPGSPGMGTHYWRYLDQNTICVDSGPVFLLYSNGVITAIGMTLVGTNGIVPTDRGIRPTVVNGRLVMPSPSLWEFARQPLYPYFFTSKETDPICLQSLNTWNSSLPDGLITTGTMHIFFKNPFNITCP